jgi:hypothetical protein
LSRTLCVLDNHEDEEHSLLFGATRLTTSGWNRHPLQGCSSSVWLDVNERRKMKKIIPLIILIAFLFGCSSQKIDSPSDKNFEKSLEKVKASLTEQKKKEVDNIFEMANHEALQIKTKNEFNGKTAEEIIAEGNRISAEQKKKEKEQMLNVASYKIVK